MVLSDTAPWLGSEAEEGVEGIAPVSAEEQAVIKAATSRHINAR
jgi:hypothetical protein